MLHWDFSFFVDDSRVCCWCSYIASAVVYSATSCFITEALARWLGAPLLPLCSPRQANRVDRHPLPSGLFTHFTSDILLRTPEDHTEYICLFYILLFSVILVLPWLNKHGHIHWCTITNTSWSPNCPSSCFQIPLQSTSIKRTSHLSPRISKWARTRPLVSCLIDLGIVPLTFCLSLHFPIGRYILSPWQRQRLWRPMSWKRWTKDSSTHPAHLLPTASFLFQINSILFYLCSTFINVYCLKAALYKQENPAIENFKIS